MKRTQMVRKLLHVNTSSGNCWKMSVIKSLKNAFWCKNRWIITLSKWDPCQAASCHTSGGEKQPANFKVNQIWQILNLLSNAAVQADARMLSASPDLLLWPDCRVGNSGWEQTWLLKTKGNHETIWKWTDNNSKVVLRSRWLRPY